jgi:hypothetical protein
MKTASLASETPLLDLGEWGTGPDDPDFCARPEELRAVYVTTNAFGRSFRFVVRVPRASWTLRMVRERFEWQHHEDVSASYDVRHVAPLDVRLARRRERCESAR